MPGGKLLATLTITVMTTVISAERWERYAEATRGKHFAWWTAEHCIQSVDRFAGQPLVLEDWQCDFMDEALAEEAENIAYWRTVVLLVPKKNGKTSLLAGYALYEVVENAGAPEVLLGAATDKQAGRLFTAARRYVKSDPWLNAQLVIRDHEGQMVQVGAFGALYRVSGDSGAEAGWNPSVVVADELAEWKTPRRKRTWANIATAGELARQAARVFVISHAGEPSERATGILGQLVDSNEKSGEIERVHRALTISRDHASRTLVYNYCANTSDPGDIDAIRAANPASWITTERLVALSRSPKLTPGQFLQLHGCVWASSAGAFLTLEEWRALEDAGLSLRRRDAVTVGFRGADGWALVACRAGDGALITLGGGPAGDTAREDADQAMQRALANYRVSVVFSSTSPEWRSVADSWRRDLGRKRVVEVYVERPSPRTDQIVKRFRADARERLVAHDGNRELAAAVLAARMTISRGHTYLTPDLERDAPISAALAAILAWEARALTPGSTPPPLAGKLSDYRIEPL